MSMKDKIDDILYFLTLWIAFFAISIQVIFTILKLMYGN